MASVLDYLAQLPGDIGAYFAHVAGGGDPNAPPAPTFGFANPAAAAQPTPSDPGAADPSAAIPLTAAAPAPITADVTLPAAAPSPAPTDKPSMVLPTLPVHSAFMNALDRGILAGGITAHDKQVLEGQMASYAARQNSTFADSLPNDALRSQFWADPQGFKTAYAKNVEPQKLAQGESIGSAATGIATTAPLFDPISGSTVQPGPGGTQTVSPSAGGGYKAEGGIILSDRTGNASGRYALPQIIKPGERIGSFTPGVVGQGAPASPQALPPLPATSGPTAAPAAPGGVPTVAQLAGLLPGARLTSGLRTPAHNAAVGGVPDSSHLLGTADAPGAMDLVPAPGESMNAFNARVQTAMPGAKVILERDHVHVQPGVRTTAVPVTPGPTVDATGSIVDSGGAGVLQYGPKTFNPQSGHYEQVNLATGKVEDAGPGLPPAEQAFQEGQGKAASDSINSDLDARAPALEQVSNAQQALAYVRAHPNDMNPLTPHLVAGANYLRSLPAAVLQAVGVDPKNPDAMANDASVYQRLSSQNLLSFSKSNLPSRYTEREMAVAGKVIPQLSTAPDAASFHWGLQAATGDKAVSKANFAANYTGAHTKQAIEQAWQNTKDGQTSLFQDPIWQNIQISGKPAVVQFPHKNGDGSTTIYGAVGPGTGHPTFFKWVQ